MAKTQASAARIRDMDIGPLWRDFGHTLIVEVTHCNVCEFQKRLAEDTRRPERSRYYRRTGRGDVSDARSWWSRLEARRLRLSFWEPGIPVSCSQVGMFRLRRSSASLHSGYAQHDTTKGGTYSETIAAVPPQLACIVQPGGDAIDRGAERIFQVRGSLAFLLAVQQLDLNQAHGVHVWIPQANGAGQHTVAREQLALAGDAQNHLAASQEFSFQHGKHSFPQWGVLYQAGIFPGDA